jgi:hypothetical protein
MSAETNALRADDQRIRRMAGELLQRARKAVGEAESRWRRDMIPPPSREHPFPPAEALAGARRLEALTTAISALDARVTHLPVPGTDKTNARYRDEAETLKALCASDVDVVEAAQALCTTIDAGPVLDNADAIEAAIGTIEARISARQTLLL